MSYTPVSTSISFFKLEHLYDKCDLMLIAIAQSLEVEINGPQIVLDEFNRLINERLHAQYLLQNRQENLQNSQPWLPVQTLFADPDADLLSDTDCDPTDVLSDTDCEDPDFTQIDWTADINLNDIYYADTE